MRRAGLALFVSAATLPPTALGAETPAPLLVATGRLAREISTLRGLPLRGPLDAVLVGQDGARAAAEAMLRRRGRRDELATRQVLLTRLGLLPQGTDLAGAHVDEIVQTTATFYDPGLHRLFVADWLGEEVQRAVLAHEIAHAVCDRRWPEEPLVTEIRGDGDRRLAHQALIEGDAVAAMLELVDATGAATTTAARKAQAEGLEDAADDDSPLWLRALRAFPYVDGLAFIMHVRARHPWSAVDALWRRPPESSEQILHPDRYLAHDGPVLVQAVPLDALITTHRVAASDTLGEFGIRVWLEQGGLAREVAERAAAGWGGDRALAFAPKDPAAGEILVAWLTVWDSDADAQEFADGAARVLGALAGAGDDPDGGRAGRLRYQSEQRGRMVALVLGGPPEHAGLCGEVLGWKTGVGAAKVRAPGAPAHAPRAPGGAGRR